MTALKWSGLAWLGVLAAGAVSLELFLSNLYLPLAQLLAWALMGIGELVGMRWILWAGRDELSTEMLDELGRIIARTIGSGNGGR